MKEPATAKEEMSTLNRLRKASPTKKNMKNIIKASRAALAAFIFLPRFFKVKIGNVYNRKQNDKRADKFLPLKTSKHFSTHFFLD